VVVASKWWLTLVDFSSRYPAVARLRSAHPVYAPRCSQDPSHQKSSSFNERPERSPPSSPLRQDIGTSNFNFLELTACTSSISKPVQIFLLPILHAAPLRSYTSGSLHKKNPMEVNGIRLTSRLLSSGSTHPSGHVSRVGRQPMQHRSPS
jgi:hypothetical protein